jgi:hypothetical protein
MTTMMTMTMTMTMTVESERYDDDGDDFFCFDTNIDIDKMNTAGRNRKIFERDTATEVH